MEKQSILNEVFIPDITNIVNGLTIDPLIEQNQRMNHMMVVENIKYINKGVWLFLNNVVHDEKCEWDRARSLNYDTHMSFMMTNQDFLHPNHHKNLKKLSNIHKIMFNNCKMNSI